MMDAMRLPLPRRRGRDGAYPALAAAAVFMAGTVAMMRWGVPMPEMVLAADPVEEIDDDAQELPPYRPDAEDELEALTDPIEEVVEPEVTDTSVEFFEPGTTAPASVPPEVVDVPAGGPTQTLPRGHWVLFDRNGQPIDAIVQPWCVDNVDDCPAFGAIAPSCVWVEWLGQLRVRVPYRLSDGDPNACYAPSGHDRASWISPPQEIAGALPDAPYSLELVYWE
jgi:hypothetical protein